MRYFKATDSTGRTYARSTENRTYAFAVTAGGASSWAGSLDLATKRVSTFDYLARRGIEVEVNHAFEIDGKEYRRIMAKNRVVRDPASRNEVVDIINGVTIRTINLGLGLGTNYVVNGHISRTLEEARAIARGDVITN